MCVWHLLWEHQAGTFSVIFLAAKALAMVLLSSTSTSLSDIFFTLGVNIASLVAS